MKTFLLMGIMILVGPGCRTHSKLQAKDHKYTPREDRAYTEALQRATEKVSEIRWISLTNTPYRIRSIIETNGDYVFTFEITDAPDVCATVRVSSTNATVESRAAPLP